METSAESVLEFSLSPIYMMDWLFWYTLSSMPTKISLIVAVVAVAFGNLRAHRLKRGLDNVVHLPDLNLGHLMVTDITLDMIADRLPSSSSVKL